MENKRYPSQEEVWLKHFDKNAKENSINIEVDKTVWNVLEEKIFEYENIPAIDYYGRKIRRLEFRNMVYNWAKSFKTMGVKKGDIVPVFSTFTPSIGAMALALNVIGACPNFIKIGLSADKYNKELVDGDFAIILSPLYNEEMDKFLSQDRFKKVFIATPYDDMIGLKKSIVSGLSKLKDYKNKTGIPKNPKYIWYDEAYNLGNYYSGELESDYTKNTPAFITYSSGTTSNELKGAIATNETVIGQLRQGKYSGEVYKEGEICLTQFPPTASTALNCLFLCPLYCGMTLKMYPSPNYKEFYGQVMESKPYHSISTGAVWREFFKEYLKKGGKTSLEFLKVPIIGGDSATLDEINWMNSILARTSDNKMSVGYGLSECFSALSAIMPGLKFATEPSNKVVHYAGIPYPGMTVGIFDENGKELGYNERGELYVKSKSNMLGYYNKPELTKEVFSGEWLKTGDVCEIDKEGRVFVYGRKKDYIEYGDNKKAYLFDIANNIRMMSNGIVTDCIIRKYEEDGKVLCHLVLNNKLINKHNLAELENLFSTIDYDMEKEYGEDLKIIGYKLHDEFKINPASLKTNKLILDKELDDFYVATFKDYYQNGNLEDLIEEKKKICENRKVLIKKWNGNN